MLLYNKGEYTRKQIMIKNRVADLTIDEFRAMMREEFHTLIRQTVHEVLEEFMSDEEPDEGLEFKPEIAERLSKFISERPDGESVDDILKELGIHER
jgi:hypothetical protein